MQKHILAIDLGTTSCKIALFDESLVCAAEWSDSYHTSFPHPGWAEQNPDDWWRIVLSGIRSVIVSSGIDKNSICSIGLDTMGSALVSVDKNNNVLCPAPLWMDRRSETEADEINAIMGRDLWDINGNRSDPSNVAPKILWLKKHLPEVYEKTDCFLHANGFLALRLTGNRSMDVTETGLTQLCRTADRDWDDRLLQLCGIDRCKLPPVVECHHIVGGITSAVAEETGLPEGIPVSAGAMDMCAAALGSGVFKAGQVYISAGTVTAVGACLDKAVFHPDLHIYPHIVPGLFITAAGVDYGGAGLKWFKGIMESDDYALIDKAVLEEEEGESPLLFLPYMVGQRAPLWNSSMTGTIAGLHPSVNKTDLYRMFMRGNAFGVRKVLNILTGSGYNIDLVKMTGGCSHSTPWMNIFANCTGIPCEVPGSSDVAVLGSAMIAAVACGLKSDYDEILRNRSAKATFSPDNTKARKMSRLYKIYDAYLNAMLPIMQALSDYKYNN